MKDSVRGSVSALKFDLKHLKKAEGYIGQNVVSVTMKMKTIVQIVKVKTFSRFISEIKKKYFDK